MDACCHRTVSAIVWTLALAIPLCVLGCRRRSADWHQAASPLFTRWAREVAPGKVWREYPRPQMVRKDWLNLNGLWQLAIVPKDAARPDTFPHRILVPFPVESALSGLARKVSPEERLWYRRTFRLPHSWRRGRILLHLDAVDWETDVYLNGVRVGQHRGGYDRFSFDITDALRPDEEQELVIAVWDPTNAGGQPVGKQTLTPGGIYYTLTSGIWQTVWLEPVPDTYISGLRLVPDVDRGSLLVSAEVRGEKTGLRLIAAAASGGKEIAHQSGPADGELILAIPSPRLWSPDDPFLYDLTVALERDGKRIDEVRSYFGMRKVAVGPDSSGVTRILVNGVPLFQIGPLDQGFWPDGIYTAPSDAALRFDVEMMKRMGFNMVRKHVKVDPERWYSWCDRLGLLVWQDMPNGANRTPEEREQFERELEAMVRGRFNHPCIIMWVTFNEEWGQYDTERIVEFVRRLDPSRLVDNASGWTDAGVGGVRDVHSYPDPVAPPAEPERAAVLGEFGGLGYVVSGHTWTERGWGYDLLPTRERLLERYVEVLTTVHRLAREEGLSAAVYTQITDVETENNGLLTYDREVAKIPPEAVARANRGYLPPHLTNRATIFVDRLNAALVTFRPGAEIHYTLDGRTPTRRDPVYTGPIPITEDCVLRAKAFWPEGQESDVATYSFRKVAPLTAVPGEGLVPGLRVRYYEGEWDSLPDFEQFQAVQEMTHSSIDLGPAKRESLFGLVYSGYFRVPATGVYLFHLRSDDGSRLWIGDQLVVDNDGLHGAREESGAIALQEGFHPFRVEYFQKRGGRALEVAIEGPDLPKQPPRRELLFH
ncbi:MAG: chitobiase/beta-hexosaminidase C-terminal domain-containing protein [Calditrichaeota bacterium]|nr:chitobiase/beta-hexosaminidase C-terminal domain-containing protein [Calditrichota bacterium]